MKLLAIILSLLVGSAQAAGLPQADLLFQLRDGQSNGSINEQIFRNLVLGLGTTLYNPKNYGAVCDGSHHSISSTLGVSTVAGIQNFQTPSGTTPYSWLNSTNWSGKVAIPMTVGATTGATSLFVSAAAQVPVGATVSGTQVLASPAPTVTSVTASAPLSSTLTGGTLTTVGTKTILLTSATGIVAGSVPVPQPGLSIDDYVVSVATNTLTMKYGITAPIPNGTSLTFQPPTKIVITGTGLTANKPSLVSAASTSTVNYWLYFSWSLTDAMVSAAEMDWLGHQAAVQAAFAQPNGGTVVSPSGTCIFDNNTVSGNTLGGVVLQPTTGGTAFTNSVDWVGNGRGNTYLSWPNDLGTGRAAVSFGVPYATWDNQLGHQGTNFFFGRFGNMSMLGPNSYSEPAIGTQTAQMTGLVAGARRDLSHLGINGFGVGMTGDGVDHTWWDELYITSNSVGLRYGPASSFLQSNNHMTHMEIWSNSIANISLDKSGFVSGSDIDTIYCSFSPKCLRLEQGPQDSYGQPSGVNLQNSTWSSVLAESIGNCFICDDNQGPISASAGLGGAEFNIDDMTFTHVSLSQSSSSQPAGTLMNYWLHLNATYNTRFYFNAGGFSFVSGMLAGAFIDFSNFGHGGDLFSADMSNTLSAFGTTPLIAVAGDVVGNSQHYSIRVEEPNTWTGHVEMVSDAVSRAPGVPMEYTTGVGGADLAVRATTGVGPFAGVNMQQTSNGGPTIVATRMCSMNPASVTLPTSGTISGNHYATLAAGGTVTNAAASNSANVIGIVMGIPGAGQARVNVGPMGSCD